MPNIIRYALVTIIMLLLVLPLVLQRRQSIESAHTQPEPALTDTSKPSVMTQAQFSQIQPKMTYAQCIQMIGSEGDYVETETPDDQPVPDGQTTYAWHIKSGVTSKDILGEAVLTFQDDVLCGKQYSSSAGNKLTSGKSAINGISNLSMALPDQSPSTPPYICRSVYDAIQNGCSYEECMMLLGVEGRYDGRRRLSMGSISPDGALSPSIADVYVWHAPSSQATLTLCFSNNRLITREITHGTAAMGSSHTSR